MKTIYTTFMYYYENKWIIIVGGGEQGYINFAIAWP